MGKYASVHHIDYAKGIYVYNAFNFKVNTMSDSNEEAFESADEGESGTPQHRSRKRSNKSSEHSSDLRTEDKSKTSSDDKSQKEDSEPNIDSPKLENIKLSEEPDKPSDVTEESPIRSQLTSAADKLDSDAITQSPHAETIERGTSEEEEKKISVLEKLSGAATEQVSTFSCTSRIYMLV